MKLKTLVGANHLTANFFEKEINSLSKKKCGYAIYLYKKGKLGKYILKMRGWTWLPSYHRFIIFGNNPHLGVSMSS